MSFATLAFALTLSLACTLAQQTTNYYFTNVTISASPIAIGCGLFTMSYEFWCGPRAVTAYVAWMDDCGLTNPTTALSGQPTSIKEGSITAMPNGVQVTSACPIASSYARNMICTPKTNCDVKWPGPDNNPDTLCLVLVLAFNNTRRISNTSSCDVSIDGLTQPASTPSPSSGSSSSSSDPITWWQILLIVVAGVMALVLTAGLFYLIYRLCRNTRKRKKSKVMPQAGATGSLVGQPSLGPPYVIGVGAAAAVPSTIATAGLRPEMVGKSASLAAGTSAVPQMQANNLDDPNRFVPSDKPSTANPTVPPLPGTVPGAAGTQGPVMVPESAVRSAAAPPTLAAAPSSRMQLQPLQPLQPPPAPTPPPPAPTPLSPPPPLQQRHSSEGLVSGPGPTAGSQSHPSPPDLQPHPQPPPSLQLKADDDPEGPIDRDVGLARTASEPGAEPPAPLPEVSPQKQSKGGMAFEIGGDDGGGFGEPPKRGPGSGSLRGRGRRPWSGSASRGRGRGSASFSGGRGLKKSPSSVDPSSNLAEDTSAAGGPRHDDDGDLGVLRKPSSASKEPFDPLNDNDGGEGLPPARPPPRGLEPLQPLRGPPKLQPQSGWGAPGADQEDPVDAGDEPPRTRSDAELDAGDRKPGLPPSALPPPRFGSLAPLGAGDPLPPPRPAGGLAPLAPLPGPRKLAPLNSSAPDEDDLAAAGRLRSEPSFGNDKGYPGGGAGGSAGVRGGGAGDGDGLEDLEDIERELARPAGPRQGF